MRGKGKQDKTEAIKVKLTTASNERNTVKDFDTKDIVMIIVCCRETFPRGELGVKRE